MAELLGKTEWKALQKLRALRAELSYDVAISFWEYIQENLELAFEEEFVHT